MKKRTTKYLYNLISQLVIDGKNDFSDCFDVFLDSFLLVLCANPNERQIDVFGKIQKDESLNEIFTDAMECYGELAERYKDPLGDMFMEHISHGRNGQFFTPECMADLMAQITSVHEDKKDGRKTINDPTCGSGRLLLAQLKECRKNNIEPYLVGQDLSMTACKMALLNLLIQSAQGMIMCGNTLTYDIENFQVFQIDNMWNIHGGKTISTYWQYTKPTYENVMKERDGWLNRMNIVGWFLS